MDDNSTMLLLGVFGMIVCSSSIVSSGLTSLGGLYGYLYNQQLSDDKFLSSNSAPIPEWLQNELQRDEKIDCQKIANDNGVDSDAPAAYLGRNDLTKWQLAGCKTNATAVEKMLSNIYSLNGDGQNDLPYMTIKVSTGTNTLRNAAQKHSLKVESGPKVCIYKAGVQVGPCIGPVGKFSNTHTLGFTTSGNLCLIDGNTKENTWCVFANVSTPTTSTSTTLSESQINAANASNLHAQHQLTFDEYKSSKRHALLGDDGRFCIYDNVVGGTYVTPVWCKPK